MKSDVKGCPAGLVLKSFNTKDIDDILRGSLRFHIIVWWEPLHTMAKSLHVPIPKICRCKNVDLINLLMGWRKIIARSFKMFIVYY